MKVPDKIYIREFKGVGLSQVWSDIKPTEETIIASHIASHEYIRKNTLLEWAKNVKRVCKGVEPLEKAYQTVIEKIESL